MATRTLKPVYSKRAGQQGQPRRIAGIQKAATYAGVSRWTMRAWIAEGKIPYVRYPGKGDADLRGAKIDLDDVDAFIERHKDRNG